MAQGETDPIINTNDKDFDALLADYAVALPDTLDMSGLELLGNQAVDALVRLTAEAEAERAERLRKLMTDGVREKTGLVFVDNADYQGWFPADAIPGMHDLLAVDLPPISKQTKLENLHEILPVEKNHDSHMYRIDKHQLNFPPSPKHEPDTY